MIDYSKLTNEQIDALVAEQVMSCGGCLATTSRRRTR